MKDTSPIHMEIYGISPKQIHDLRCFIVTGCQFWDQNFDSWTSGDHRTRSWWAAAAVERSPPISLRRGKGAL